MTSLQRNRGKAQVQCPKPAKTSSGRLPKEKGKPKLPFRNGAGKEARTLDLNLGKVALYQLSYSRIC